MKFTGNQKSLKFTQLNTGWIEDVFPLLCPVREKDWLDGWEYHMIHSLSGVIEKDCVFTTPHHGKSDTVWHVTQYDSATYMIEFFSRSTIYPPQSHSKRTLSTTYFLRVPFR